MGTSQPGRHPRDGLGCITSCLPLFASLVLLSAGSLVLLLQLSRLASLLVLSHSSLSSTTLLFCSC